MTRLLWRITIHEPFIRREPLELAGGPDQNRTSYHPNNISGYLRKDLEAAGLPRVRFHDLRHSLATIVAADGTHVVVIAGMLGHANPTTTLSTYPHFVPGMQSMSIRRLNEIFPASLVRGISRSCPSSRERPSGNSDRPLTEVL